MRPIVRWSLYNRSVVVLLSLIFLAGGVFGLGRINQELLPNIEGGAGSSAVASHALGPMQLTPASSRHCPRP
jgi:hypothetical protein